MTTLLTSLSLLLSFTLLSVSTLRADDPRPRPRIDGSDSVEIVDTAAGSDKAIADTLSARHTPVRRLIDATYVMMEEMITISESIKTVKDADKARKRVAEAMGGVTAVAEEVGADDEPITMEELEEFDRMREIMQSEERYIELSERAEAVMEEMKTKRPKAAKRFREITNEESATMTAAMTTALERALQRAFLDE